MEPLAASSAGAVIRPAAAALQQDLSAVLRHGRVLAGEVLQSPGDGSILIAIGRHRVPAETHVLLNPGEHFLFRVESGEGEVVLRLLGSGDPTVSQLLQALRGVVGEERPVGELLQDLAHQIRAALERPGAPVEDLRQLQEALARHVPRPGAGGSEAGALLQQILLQSGLRYEAALAAALSGGASAQVLERLQGDLKAELLRAFAELENGPLRETLARTLAGIEAEQLLNLARQRAGEPLVWSFPFPDAGGWTTARLLVHAREEDEGDSSGAAEATRHPDLVLGVRFSNLGPIRAELSMSEQRLDVRLLVTSAELAVKLKADFTQLAERLGAGRSVHLFARVGTPAEVDVAESPLDIRFLREHRLMDVSG